jgi:AAA15 family ATPase/GTPase
MATLKVLNFGPIKELEWEIKDYNLFIGPQAAGKSTIAKLVYYFLSLKDEVGQYVFEASNKVPSVHTPDDIKKLLCKKFHQFFDIEKAFVNPSFRIEFQYRENHIVCLYWNGATVSMDIPPSFDESLLGILKEARSIFRRKTNSLLTEDASLRIDLQNFENQITRLQSLFGDNDATIIYVPACRSLLTALSIDVYKIKDAIDDASKDFVDRIMELRKLFNKSFADIIEEKEQLSLESLDKKSLLHIRELISKILKGVYKYTGTEERLYYNETDYVPLSLASSGQQEAVWILQLIFSLVLNNKKATLVIEEPEAHLFPETQAYMVQLISLFARLKGNRVILTTHSPYILSTVNNLLYAAKVGAKHPEEVNGIVPSYCWINYDTMGTCYVDKGRIESLMEDDSKQIKIGRIDEISNELNKQFDTLLQIDDDEI